MSLGLDRVSSPSIPVREPDIKNASDIEEVWQILDNGYGQAVNICVRQLKS
jgi:hypothetical protein